MERVRLYLHSRPGSRKIALFDERPSEHKTEVTLYGDASTIDRSGYELVDDPAQADFIIVPHSARHLTAEFMSLVQDARQIALTHAKQCIVFLSGDLAYNLHIPGVVVFKASLYLHDKLPEEVTSVPFVRDLSLEVPLSWRSKSAQPSVSFCGFAGFPHIKTRLKFEVVNRWLDVISTVLQRPYLHARKRGIYFRREALNILKKDPRIETRFIIRTAFFHQEKQDPKRMRQEYLDNMQNADFVLCPKGDGNYSIRFFEVLSLGRIPILIDTDMALPLEKELDYSKFILRIPHTELHTLPDRVVALYNSLSDEEFKAMQQAARDAYVQYLRQDRFYSRAFALLKAKGPEAL